MMVNEYELICFSILLITAIAYLNVRLTHLPTTTAIMSGTLLITLFIIFLSGLGDGYLESLVYKKVAAMDFSKILMQGMLSFLLFAGALNINVRELWRCKLEISLLSTVSTVCSTILIALFVYLILPLINIKLQFIYCLLFGALISPTDPIAVLALFKNFGGNETTNVTLTGESLFNDGVGIALFLPLFQLAYNHLEPTFSSVTLLFLQEFIGGIAFGALIGYLGLVFIRPLSDIKVTLLITLCIATVGYMIATKLEISGPLAMVAAGIIIGSESQKTEFVLHQFWELVDELLNAALFFLLGLELVEVSHSTWTFNLCLIAILICLIVRFITVILPISILSQIKKYPKNFIKVLTWGGLRGGLAVALALSLPNGFERDIILTMTYSVVVFSILIQGLSVKKLIIN
jgi:CPA1 family monovalent cation:H+ antiporter